MFHKTLALEIRGNENNFRNTFLSRLLTGTGGGSGKEIGGIVGGG